MIIARLFIAIALPLMIGYCAVALIIKNKLSISFLERFSLSWGVGIGLLGLGMFTLSLCSIPLNLITVMLPTSMLILGCIFYLFINKFPVFDLSKLNNLLKAIFEIKNKGNWWIILAEKTLILLISITIIYVFFDALVKPVVNYDAIWRQGCIAKIIFTSGKVLTKQALELAGPHPYLNPLSQAWVYMAIGTWNDALGKIIFPFCFSALLFIFYCNLRKYTSRIYSLLFTYLLTSFPLIIFHAGTAYSDLMQTFYYSVGIIYLFQWMKIKQSAYLYTSAIFLGIGNFVKQTGIPLWGAASIILFIYLFIENKKQLKSGIYFILTATLISSPWLFYQNSFLIRTISGLWGKILGIFGQAAITGVESGMAQNQSYSDPTLLNILYHLGRRMFTYADWQILWFIFILCVLFGWNIIRKTELKYVLLIIFLNLGMIIYAFSSAETYQFLVDGTLVQRIMMYQIPVVLFFVGYILDRPRA